VVQAALLGVLRAYRGPADLEQLYSYTARAVQNEAAKLHHRRARKESRLVSMPSGRLPDRTGTRVPAGLMDPEASDPLDLAIDGEELVDAAHRLISWVPSQRSRRNG
jgi:DNA-directed RNA polymerase specialized sigma24 family protein